MLNEKLLSLTQTQRDRLAFVELRVRFVGDIRRQDLVSRFAIQTAAATRDLALYRELAPANITYDPKAKTYAIGDEFQALFDYAPDRLMAWLCLGFGDGEPVQLKPWVTSDIPARLMQPQLDTLACVTRAINFKCPLTLTYHSLTSGETKREIVPFALIDNGLRWHVRAFDRRNLDFRDFALTRMTQPRVMKDAEVLPHEQSDQDIQWTRIVEVDLVPHPDQPHPEITAMDYGMMDGALKMKLRAATAGYVLRQWSVDCSPDHSLRGHEHRLWLNDHLALYGVKNAVLAPGYRELRLDEAKTLLTAR